MKPLLIQKQVQFSNKSDAKPFWETVEWSVEQYGSTIRLTSKIRGLTTSRMWQLNEHGDDIEKQKAYFLEQMNAAQNDLITRLAFIFMAMRGDLNDDVDGVEIKWAIPPTT